MNCIIGCGGTFDKIYNPIRECMTFDGSSAIPVFLRDAKIRDWEFVQLFQMDSLDLQERDRERLANEILRSDCSRFVVVHGTSRMVESAKYLRERVVSQTIVFTGALIPYRYSPIEAAANLSGAMVVAEHVEPGTYIHMHGHTFKPENCHKDPSTGMFIAAP